MSQTSLLPDNVCEEIDRWKAKFPANQQRSAVIGALHAVQHHNEGYLTAELMNGVAEYLDLPTIQVYEVATFYTMYNFSPVGKYHIQVCTTTPCMISGAYDLIKVCKAKISDNENELLKNKNCSWTEVECLGACINAPMMQINEDYYEDLDKVSTEKIINQILTGKNPKPGSYKGRKNSEPQNNRKTLIDINNA